ncbi:MAG: tRNA dihydrouridine synthase DusB [Collinsella sp.]|nr:tRNA dihydrouridine synthase DusB [Collinsella sp.]
MTHCDRSGALSSRLSSQPFLLAPMAGVTDAAYRIMCRRRGAEMAYSEMVSVAGLAYASEKTWELVLPAAEEGQICVQLFGSKPEQFASAVAAVEERVGDKLDLIDINMACPARKVISKGEGSALMEQPDLAEQIVRSCVSAAHVPVTVKMRKDFRSGRLLAPDFAARMEQAGAAAVAVHGRSAGQLYSGSADWSVIDAVADRVSIPVIGTGDVFTASDAVRMLTQTGASAVFVARGTYGNPWVFDDARSMLLSGEAPAAHGSLERLAALREHLGLLRDMGAHMARARTFATWYLKGMPHAAAWRGRVVKCSTFEGFMSLVDAIESDVVACEERLAEGLPVPAEPPLV